MSARRPSFSSNRGSDVYADVSSKNKSRNVEQFEVGKDCVRTACPWSLTLKTMHPHPLAIIPLKKDLLLPSETSSTSSSRASSPDSNASTNVPMRALVPINPPQPQQDSSISASGATELVRSEDDTALLRSLIRLLPHEQADSQVYDAGGMFSLHVISI